MKLPDKKKVFLEALEKHLGNVTKAARACSINRSDHYYWMKDDASYKAKTEEITDVAIDFVEDKLREKINGVECIARGKKGDVVYELPPSDTAIIFFLKTKGRKRGWNENEGTPETKEQINIIFKRND